MSAFRVLSVSPSCRLDAPPKDSFPLLSSYNDCYDFQKSEEGPKTGGWGSQGRACHRKFGRSGQQGAAQIPSLVIFKGWLVILGSEILFRWWRRELGVILKSRDSSWSTLSQTAHLWRQAELKFDGGYYPFNFPN